MEAALALWELGSQTQAKREAALAQDLSRGRAVLGSNTSPSDLIRQWETEPAKIESQFAYWNAVAGERPDYRDALVMAAAYAYQLGNTEEARTLINRAFALDPASPTARELKTIIGEN